MMTGELSASRPHDGLNLFHIVDVEGADAVTALAASSSNCAWRLGHENSPLRRFLPARFLVGSGRLRAWDVSEQAHQPRGSRNRNRPNPSREARSKSIRLKQSAGCFRGPDRELRSRSNFEHIGSVLSRTGRRRRDPLNS